MRKLKKAIFLSLEIKKGPGEDTLRKKEYMKNYYYKKNLLNHLIIHAQENLSLNK